jgi:hypothetical protein
MIELSLLIDALVVLLCGAVLLRFGRLAHSHPGTIYLFFHVFVVTLRLVALCLGAPTLFSTWRRGYEPVTYDEIMRVALMADAALVLMTLAWLRASAVESRRALTRPLSGEPCTDTLSLRDILPVVLVTLPIGILALTLFRDVLGVAVFGGTSAGAAAASIDLDTWSSSNWVQMTAAWTGLSMLALIYWFGFRWWLMAPILPYLLLMGYQGYHRYRVIIPIILMTQIYLDRRRLRWPSLRVSLLLITAALLFFPLKAIGRLSQVGATTDEIATAVTTVLQGTYSRDRESGDQQLLDQCAATVSSIDRNGKLYYGGTYLPLLTAPIPRPWWPDKPGLADWMGELSTRRRPLKQCGMVPTLLGELYANFGYLGVLLLPYLVAYVLGRAYFRAYRNRYFSVSRLSYLLLACNLVQIYRDGLISVVTFTVINMMPLAMIVALARLRHSHPRSAISNEGRRAGIDAARYHMDEHAVPVPK